MTSGGGYNADIRTVISVIKDEYEHVILQPQSIDWNNWEFGNFALQG